MNTTKNNPGKRSLKIALIALVLMLAIPFSMGMYAGITSHMGTTGEIGKLLQSNCNCETIDFDHSAYGITFSKKEGMNGNAVAFTLKECDLKVSVTDEANRLHKMFQEEIIGYHEVELLYLNFEKGGVIQTVTFQNGVINN